MHNWCGDCHGGDPAAMMIRKLLNNGLIRDFFFMKSNISKICSLTLIPFGGRVWLCVTKTNLSSSKRSSVFIPAVSTAPLLPRDLRKSLPRSCYYIWECSAGAQLLWDYAPVAKMLTKTKASKTLLHQCQFVPPAARSNKIYDLRFNFGSCSALGNSCTCTSPHPMKLSTQNDKGQTRLKGRGQNGKHGSRVANSQF